MDDDTSPMIFAVNRTICSATLGPIFLTHRLFLLLLYLIRWITVFLKKDCHEELSPLCRKAGNKFHHCRSDDVAASDIAKRYV
jgi:hypothetical protein